MFKSGRIAPASLKVQAWAGPDAKASALPKRLHNRSRVWPPFLNLLRGPEVTGVSNEQSDQAPVRHGGLHLKGPPGMEETPPGGRNDPGGGVPPPKNRSIVPKTRKFGVSDPRFGGGTPHFEWFVRKVRFKGG